MKRWPLIASFVLFVVLSASAAYWALQLFQPPLRPVAAPPRAAAAEIRPEAAAGLFGGRSAGVAVASNYQLRGVVFSGNPRDSVAILGADGKPPQAIRVGSEVVPGVSVKEVHRGYVLLADGEGVKRVELQEGARASAATGSPVSARPMIPPPPPVSNRPAPVLPSEVPAVPEQVPPAAPESAPTAATDAPDAAAARQQAFSGSPEQQPPADFAPGTGASVVVDPGNEAAAAGAPQDPAGQPNQ
jgi:general secretion pathway protein C